MFESFFYIIYETIIFILEPMALTGSKVQMLNLTEDAVTVHLWTTNDINGPIRYILTTVFYRTL